MHNARAQQKGVPNWQHPEGWRPKEGKEIHTEGSMTESDISEELQHYLLIEEDASPRLLKSSKREKKQANGEDNQPIRV
uniref:Uncharacterized protein n=1 Tax=Solanum tuberosum TaxID=4113 RepID=M1DFX4_SOLTU